jgi:putative PIN family toxin of toxin-antitoxin system
LNVGVIRAVIDLNVIISAVISLLGIPHRIWTAWHTDERFTLVISDGMIQELAGKLATPTIARRYGIGVEDVNATTTLLRTIGSLVVVPAEAVTVVTADPEDDLVLASALLGQADYLVTGDRGLLDLGRHDRVAILSPRDFLGVLAID